MCSLRQEHKKTLKIRHFFYYHEPIAQISLPPTEWHVDWKFYGDTQNLKVSLFDGRDGVVNLSREGEQQNVTFFLFCFVLKVHSEKGR